MPKNSIIFQLATHYLPKVALRIERLLLTIEQACKETHPVIHHYALNNMFEIIKLIEKPELKSRFLKEFMRIEHSLNKASVSLSNAAFAKLFVQIQQLSHLSGQFGKNIHTDPFLQSMRLAQSSHSIDCELHSPQLLLWLESEPAPRQRDLTTWLKQLRTLLDTVSIYLSLLRETASFETITLINGFYQCALPVKSSCHLIMLRMDKHCGIVPKMQLGQHGLSLRLCEAHSMREIHNTNTAIDLSICQL